MRRGAPLRCRSAESGAVRQKEERRYIAHQPRTERLAGSRSLVTLHAGAPWHGAPACGATLRCILQLAIGISDPDKRKKLEKLGRLEISAKPEKAGSQKSQRSQRSRVHKSKKSQESHKSRKSQKSQKHMKCREFRKVRKVLEIQRKTSKQGA